MEFEKVSVVVPVLNEEKYIAKFLDSLLSQDYPKDCLEIILVDGNSDDKTRDIINIYLEKYNFIKLLENNKKTVQYAMNIGIKNSSGDYIVRMDAHAWYASDYISKCIEYIKSVDAQNVGGPTVVKGKTHIQKIIAAAYSSPFALGGGKHYDPDFEGYCDTVSWGCFKKEYLMKIGMYDERLPRSEDDDLNLRISENGGKIFITPKIKSEYYPKESFSKLFKQYFNYGVWKIAVIKKHKKVPRIGQLVPMAFAGFLISFSLFSLFSKFFLSMLLLGLILYMSVNLYFSFKTKSLKNFFDKILLSWACFVIHFSYGLGFFKGIFKFMGSEW